MTVVRSTPEMSSSGSSSRPWAKAGAPEIVDSANSAAIVHVALETGLMELEYQILEGSASEPVT